MTYENRLQIGDYLITIDIEGTTRRGYTAAVFFEWAREGGKQRIAAIKHALPDRFTVASKAHHAAFEHAVGVVKTNDVGLPPP